MQNSPHTLTKDIVLIGGGHTHALVLRMWAMRPLAGVRLTVINPGPCAAYSGMLPGFVAGHYTRADLNIDLMRLAQAAGARIILGAVTGIDRQAKTITVPGRPDVGYDIASIDVGITTEMPSLPGFAAHAIAAKPLADFADRWHAYCAAPKGDIAVIGGGIAGAELAMAMAHAAPSRAVHIIDRGPALAELGGRARALMLDAMSGLGITLVENSTPREITDQGVILEDGDVIPAGFITGVAAPQAQAWPAQAELDHQGGFIRISPQLQSADPDIFASGDCAYMEFAPRPKAGVFAVRQAPILFHNLRAAAMGRPLRSYRPQKRYLKLVSLGARKAMAERGGMVFAGKLLWRWKDHIDRRFMTRLNNLRPMAMPLPRDHALGDKGPEMMCAGCGSKVGRGVLAQAIQATGAKRSDVARLPGDDAAVLQIGGTSQVLTTDHLRALTPDPYVMTKIAAHHALGDIWAMGAAPQSALVSLVLPRQTAELQSRSMVEIMAAAHEVMDASGAAIIGGHSAMGAELIIGFSLTGLLDRPAITLAGAQPGDAVIVTKPIGSGTIMAAAMALRAPGQIIAHCIDTMCQGQGDAARILHRAHAMTDITGFGLAGHLAGICDASAVGARITLDAVPIQEGALELAQEGIRSSLWADNVDGAAQVTCPPSARGALMFDPQTAGGLMACVAPDQAQDCITTLSQAGYQAAVIGQITEDPAIIIA